MSTDEIEDTWAADVSTSGRRRAGLPSEIGRFVVRGLLGAGAMGRVFEAEDPVLGRDVAVKVMQRPGRSKSLRREAQAMAALNHPHVVVVHDVGTHEEQVFIAMELIRGGTLREFQRGRTADEILEVYRQAGEGLAAAHRAGVVHRDFKPDNVLVELGGRAVVTDFGLALPTAGGADRKRGVTPGTPAYMAPELFEGEPATTRSDQFAFCAALYEALYGTRPFTGDTVATIALSVTTVAAAEPAAKDVPPWIWPVLRRGLSRDPSRRWPEMADVVAALHRPRPRWPLAVLGSAAVGAVAFVVFSPPPLPPGCADSSGRLDPIWNDATRGRLSAAFEGTGLPFASDTWARVEVAVDAYAAAWTDAYSQSCAARAKGAMSDMDFDARMACLRVQRESLDAALGAFAEPDARVLVAASAMVPALDDAGQCQPGSSGAYDEAAERALAEINRLRLLGNYAEARAQGEALLAGMTDVAAPDLRARAELSLARTLRAAGDPRAESEALAQAYQSALEAGRDDLASRAAAVSAVVSARSHESDAAKRWIEHAAALAARLADEDGTVARSLVMARAVVANETGDFAEAERGYKELVELEAELEPSVRSGTEALTALYIAMHRNEEARAVAERHLQELEPMGPMHPLLAATLDHLATLDMRAGDYAAARAKHERVLELLTRTWGPTAADLIVPLNNLGAVVAQTGDGDGARALFEQALAIDRGARSPDLARRAFTLHNLGAIVGGRSPGDAIPYFSEALAILETLYGDEDPRLLPVLGALAETYVSAQAPALGMPHLQRAETLQKRHFPPGHMRAARLAATRQRALEALAEPVTAP